MAAQASFAGVAFGLPALAPTLRSVYHLRLLELGVVLGAPSAGMLIGLIPWGLAADRFGERLVIAAGMAGAAGALAASAVVEPFPLLVACLVVAGTFGASANIASGRAVMHVFDADERGLALGIRQTAATIGTACAAATLPLLGNLRAAFFVLAATCASTAVAAALTVPSAGAARAQSTSYRPLHDRRLWRLCHGSALICAAQNCVNAFAVLFLHEHEQLSSASAGAALVAINVLGTVLRVAVGAVSDRSGRRLHPLVWLSAMFAVALVATALLVDAPRAVTVVAIVATGGLGLSWNGLSYAATAELAGAERSGAGIALQQTMLTASGASAPIAFGAILALTSSWRTSFALAAAAPVLGVWILSPLARSEAARHAAAERGAGAVSADTGP
jgi:MFS family permease